MTHLDMLRALAEANRNRDWAEAARLRTLVTTPTPCATPAEAAYCPPATSRKESTMFYTITIETRLGEGDYSSDQKIVHEEQLNLAQLARAIIALEEKGEHVCVFLGQGLGILQYETGQAGYRAE